jgi:hypothetical protein
LLKYLFPSPVLEGVSQFTAVPHSIGQVVLIAAGKDTRLQHEHRTPTMSHIISRRMASNVLALLAASIFFFSGQMARAQTVDLEPQAVLAGSSWGIQTPQGTNMSWFNADGTCTGMAQMARNNPVSYKCRYEVRSAGQGRIALSVRSNIDGYRQTSTETLRIMPDGNLYNESARAIAYRLRPDGTPFSDTRRR